MSRENCQSTDKAKKKSGMARWLSQFKSWVAVSEPSGQAFEQHRKDMFKNNGVLPRDPDASMKLHVPPTRIPEEAIKPSGLGPDPEDLAAARRRNRQACAGSSASRSVQSYSTTSSRPGWRPELGAQSPRSPG
ncbi:hypothetical protein KVR01_005258 [Diaporthe batatas]|uniref:uncharacterized protein n=1 Tax=Diaporthe batatas TaxID=748121 RepID=UPI001D0475A8|nr:uncharacterized protein KVR01_005258 [Diaporthe batatas]KAG8164983.1 hypothetical protein KVR01_005258 [Diaporthe batatas]